MLLDFNYREILRSELAKRCQANERYSLRDFARDIEIAPSRLSEVFHNKQGLSRVVAEKIARKLSMNTEETSLFCDLVEAEHARSAEARLLAKIRLEERSLDHEYSVLKADTFQAISHWYHFAIFQLATCRGFKSNPESVAKKLAIHREQAKDAIDRLIRLKILNKMPDGQLKAARDFIATTDGIPSDAIKNFHRQILEKASYAILEQSVENRNFSANVIAIRKSDMAKAKDMMKRFRRRFVKELNAEESNLKDSVYCLSMQFFELTKEGY